MRCSDQWTCEWLLEGVSNCIDGAWDHVLIETFMSFLLPDQICNMFLSFLFSFKDGKGEKSDAATSASGKATMKSVLENLGELWDQEQYDSEYSLEKFMHSLK